MHPYVEATRHDIERAYLGVLTIERAGPDCYRFFNYDDENPDELWENYHRTYNWQDPSQQAVIDRLEQWLADAPR